MTLPAGTAMINFQITNHQDGMKGIQFSKS
jgi:hypothetical protein